MLGLRTLSDTYQGIEDVDNMYARIMSDKQNATAQHPLVTTAADATIDAALFMITGNMLESYGLTEGMSATAAFVTNQYAQFVQDATITYMPRYFEYAADGVITENEKQAFLKEVAVGELANLTLGTFDAIVKMRAASATPAKSVTENTGSGTADASVNSGVGYKGPEGGNKLKIAEVIPPGSTHPVKVYTDGNAQINTGKIDTYIRGKIELDVKATTTRIDELKDIRKSNPENFTKEMKKELQNCEDMLHNYQRSQEMSKTLNTAGIEDTIENNQMIVENLFDAAKEVTDGNTEIISYIEGANGKVQVISRWKVLPDDTRYLATVILKPVK